MEVLGMTPEFWRGKRVLVTGHTGFKGGWLCLWLQSLGADVHGYALAPPTNPNFFSVAQIEREMASNTIADIRDFERLASALNAIKPEIVFHLAAQALVKYAYQNPLETYDINVMGLVNLLEALRKIDGIKVIVNVTTDKCYENREWPWGYRENEPLGGHDPYSSSKACAELVTAAYRNSFHSSSGIAVATARAGNVIGGGDWAADRLIPDFLRALDAGRKLEIRSPQSTRPWQHVLEPLSGYLLLAEHLYLGGMSFAEAWNFGPADGDVQQVRWIIEHLAKMRKDVKWECDGAPQPHEAVDLKLDSSKAHTRLQWYPRWRLQTALLKTMEWHGAWRRNEDMRLATLQQITDHQSADSSDGRVTF